MWCRVQVCCGPNGERLKRAKWSKPVEGDLTIGNAKHAPAAWLECIDVGRRYQVLFPLGDARVQTYGDGILVIGVQVNAESEPIRECRQAWYCVPVAPPLRGTVSR